MVPVEGIEPPTFGLQNRCSTAELNRHSTTKKTSNARGDVRCFGRYYTDFGRGEKKKMKGVWDFLYFFIKSIDQFILHRACDFRDLCAGLIRDFGHFQVDDFLVQ